MKKKKLKKRIYELESENRRAKDHQDYLKDMIMRFMEGLGKYGVKAEIVFPEPPLIEYLSEEDMTMKYMPGMTTEPPTIQFDFSKHDSEIVKKVAEK